jgi:hypothetical protein
MNGRAVAAILWAVAVLQSRAAGHSEFQAFVRSSSGRAVDCALCHTHSNGPEGTAAGQIGGLSADELSRLGRARAAFEPGAGVDSPILNDFGDLLVQRLGKKRILELRSAPNAIPGEIGFENDLDQDGIPDAREYLEGTHPLIASDGDPWALFVHNLRRSGIHVALISIATAITLFGLVNLLHGFAVRLRARDPDGSEGGPHA